MTISLLTCAFCTSHEHEIVLQECKSEQKQFQVLNLYKTRKSTNFGLIEEGMEMSRIFLAVKFCLDIVLRPLNHFEPSKGYHLVNSVYNGCLVLVSSEWGGIMIIHPWAPTQFYIAPPYVGHSSTPRRRLALGAL